MKNYHSPKIEITLFDSIENICASAETTTKNNVIELPDDDF